MYIASKRCDRCGYERRAQDSAPDWRCPSCGVAYAKAGGSGASTPAHPRGRAAAGGDGGLAKWVVAGLCAIGVAWLVNETVRYEGSYGLQPQAVAVTAEATDQPRVVMYATSWCGYCQKSRDFFHRYGILYTEYDVERDREAYRENRRLGGGGVPMIKVGDQVVSGYNPQRLTQLLEPWMR